jgi:hypothetical protein
MNQIYSQWNHEKLSSSEATGEELMSLSPLCNLDLKVYPSFKKVDIYYI